MRILSTAQPTPRPKFGSRPNLYQSGRGGHKSLASVAGKSSSRGKLSSKLSFPSSKLSKLSSNSGKLSGKLAGGKGKVTYASGKLLVNGLAANKLKSRKSVRQVNMKMFL